VIIDTAKVAKKINVLKKTIFFTHIFSKYIPKTKRIQQPLSKRDYKGGFLRDKKN
jgi:hypothetical protein